MRLKFTATFSVDDYKRHNISRMDDIIALRYMPEFNEKVRRELRKLVLKNSANKEKGRGLVEIDVDMDIHYKKRSLDQNRWLWMAHTLEAAIVNNKKVQGGAIRWNTPDDVTPEMIHEDYMERFAPRGVVFAETGFIDCIRTMLQETQGRVVEEKWLPDEKRMMFTVWKTSSYLNVAEFCELGDKVTEQILSYGIDINRGVDFKRLAEDLETIRQTGLTPETESATMPEIDIF